MIALLQTLSMVLTLVWWVFLIMIIMSWLISFNVINTRNAFVAGLWQVVNANNSDRYTNYQQRTDRPIAIIALSRRAP